MTKGIPNKRYTGEFKQKVVEMMQEEGLSYCEAARQFKIRDHKSVAAWERIYLEEGPEGLHIERRGRASAASETKKGRPPKLDKKGGRRAAFTIPHQKQLMTGCFFLSPTFVPEIKPHGRFSVKTLK